MSTWEATADPRIQVLCHSGIGYQVRWAIPVPASRARCQGCGKDLVPKKDASMPKHKCVAKEPERGYRYAREAGKMRLFGTRMRAYAVASEELGLTIIPEQIVSRVLSGIPN